MGALNNEAGETNEYRFREFGLRKYFKVSLSSCYLGLRKPEPAIYLRALDILGGRRKRVLFIDDRPENVAAAQEEGIKGIVFNGADVCGKSYAALTFCSFPVVELRLCRRQSGHSFMLGGFLPDCQSFIQNAPAAVVQQSPCCKT